MRAEAHWHSLFQMKRICASAWSAHREGALEEPEFVSFQSLDPLKEKGRTVQQIEKEGNELLSFSKRKPRQLSPAQSSIPFSLSFLVSADTIMKRKMKKKMTVNRWLSWRWCQRKRTPAQDLLFYECWLMFSSLSIIFLLLGTRFLSHGRSNKGRERQRPTMRWKKTLCAHPREGFLSRSFIYCGRNFFSFINSPQMNDRKESMKRREKTHLSASSST